MKYKRNDPMCDPWDSQSGDFGGNVHRGTRLHSMQSFGGPSHSKMT